MRRLATSWLIFVIVELLAVVCWFWPLMPDSIASFAWGTQLWLLLPGSIIADLIIDSVLGDVWIPPLPSSVLYLSLSILANGLLYWLAVTVWARLVVRLRSNKSLERTRDS